jgi:hypothetical protein
MISAAFWMGGYSGLRCCSKARPASPKATAALMLAAQLHKSNMQAHGFCRHQQLLRIRSRAAHLPLLCCQPAAAALVAARRTACVLNSMAT